MAAVPRMACLRRGDSLDSLSCSTPLSKFYYERVPQLEVPAWAGGCANQKRGIRMTKYLCRTCGVQYPDAAAPPPRCLICEDGRQFVPKAGQEWVTPEKLTLDRFNAFRMIAPGLFGLWT